jgi:hypothetical protein
VRERDASGRIRDRLVAVYNLYTLHGSILLVAELLNWDMHTPITAEPIISGIGACYSIAEVRWKSHAFSCG